MEENKKLGYVKLYRSLTDWQWFYDIKTCHLFIYCLLRANIECGSWKNINYKAGEFVTSLQKLSLATGLSVQEVRTSLIKLKSTHELTTKTTNRNTIISINNWNDYQVSNKQINKQITNNQQTNNKQITTDKNIRNKEVKNINTTTTYIADENFKNFYGEYKNVYLIQSDIKKLETYTQSKEKLKKLIDELDVAIETQKEKPYNAEHIHAHYERIKAFCDFQRKYPNGKGVTNTFTRYKSEAEKKADKIREMKERGLL